MKVEDILKNRPLEYADLARMIAQGADTESGAQLVFIGTVRADRMEKKMVEAIEYTAYPQMVVTEGGSIVREILDRYPGVHNIRFIHSTGRVAAGKWSLLLFVSGGHREQAQKACRDALELIKERLPVWKKEVFSDASERWK